MALEHQKINNKYIVIQNLFLKIHKQEKDKTSQTEQITEGIK